MSNKRYIKNAETVRKIAGIFSLKLLSFDPDWTFINTEMDDGHPRFVLDIISQSTLSNYNVPDDFMCKVALLLGLPWVFTEPTEELEKSLDVLKLTKNNIGKDRPDLYDIIKNPDPKEQKELDKIRSMMDSLDNQSSEEIDKRINHIKFILNTRKKISELMIYNI